MPCPCSGLPPCHAESATSRLVADPSDECGVIPGAIPATHLAALTAPSTSGSCVSPATCCHARAVACQACLTETSPYTVAASLAVVSCLASSLPRTWQHLLPLRPTCRRQVPEVRHLVQRQRGRRHALHLLLLLLPSWHWCCCDDEGFAPGALVAQRSRRQGPSLQHGLHTEVRRLQPLNSFSKAGPPGCVNPGVGENCCAKAHRRVTRAASSQSESAMAVLGARQPFTAVQQRRASAPVAAAPMRRMRTVSTRAEAAAAPDAAPAAPAALPTEKSGNNFKPLREINQIMATLPHR